MQYHHMALAVPDMDQAIETYCGHLGMELLRRKAGQKYKEVAMLQDPHTGQHVELLLIEGVDGQQFDHVGFLSDQVDEDFARLEATGFKPIRKPFDLPGGQVRTSFLQAPDDTLVEVIDYS